jgi:hypothetical protein
LIGAISKEAGRVEGLGAWELAPARQIRADRLRHLNGRVSAGYLVSDKDGAAASGILTQPSCAGNIASRIVSAEAQAIDGTTQLRRQHRESHRECRGACDRRHH